MEIKASQVKELRDMTGVAMMDCKKALVECEGDIEKALDLLRSNSALKAEKKSSRVAADGILITVITENYATIVEINSETDFAAKDSNFLSFGEKVKNYIKENTFLRGLGNLVKVLRAHVLTLTQNSQPLHKSLTSGESMCDIMGRRLL